MLYYLSRRAALKWLETPSVYQISKDELYELDQESFRFIRDCMAAGGCASRDTAFIDYCIEEGILTAELVSGGRPPVVQSPVPSLRYLELQITDACNLRCNHCYIGDGAGSELPVAQIRSLLAEFDAMQGLRVLLSGGEPLMHTRFPEINEMLPDFYLRKVLFTNGLLLKKELLKALKVDELQISIDGLRASHDGIRGAGTYDRALEALRLALDAGFAVSISTMVHRANLSDFDRLEALFKEIGIKDWTVDVPCPAGRMKEHPELLISPGEGGRLLGYGFGAGLHSSGKGFGCGLHLMSVLADGRTAKCTFYGDQAVGTIEEGLATAWHRIKPVLLKDLSCDCDYLEVCRGGCRYRAEQTEGPGGKDRYRCMLYGVR
ncbi:MAG: hypothetical protein A2078_05035 [Nitrospirae bacterium GWC2_57_9]|nr:MAG: hypothetical protein A2078_05035 [Nitrospirae bacterium GWC2_57_9]